MARRIVSEDNADLTRLLSTAWRMRFPKEQEQLFHDDHYRKTIPIARIALGIGLIVNVFFVLLDSETLSFSRNYVSLIRYVLVSPVVALCLLLICLPGWKALAQPALSLLGIVLGAANTIIIALTYSDGSGYTIHQISLLLVIIATYTFIQLRFVYAVLIGWLDVALYIIVAGVFQHTLTSEQGMTFFFSNIFFCIIANIMGMFACYSMELYLRRDFVQRQLIEREKNKSEQLLLNILPKDIVSTLKESPRPIADLYNNISILFADIVNFTPLSAQLQPVELLELLNEMFSHFDTLSEKYGLEKIKTIGDCYMVASGVPGMRPDHAPVLAKMGLEMQEFVQQHRFLNGLCLDLRIGINSGPVVAGIIGHKKFSYDLWGDTVNTASRMESHGAKGKIQITRSTYELVKDQFECEANSTIFIKGKGEMEVWYLTGEKSVQPQLAGMQLVA